jgi:hypothetical protein
MTSRGGIRGRVVDPLGQAVKEFQIVLRRPTTLMPEDRVGSLPQGYLLSTSRDGTFVISDLDVGCVYRVCVIAPGFGAAEEDRVLAVSLDRLVRAAPLTLRLDAARSLRVRVREDGGPAVCGAHVTLIPDNEIAGTQAFRWESHFDSGMGWLDRPSDGDGVADFQFASSDKMVVVARARGFARKSVVWDHQAPELTINLAPESIVQGDIRDERENISDAASVELWSNRDSITVMVDPTSGGKFRVTELPAGDYHITVFDARRRMLFHQRIALARAQVVELKIRVPKR